MPKKTRKDLKIALVGSTGRMGVELQKLIESDQSGLTLVNSKDLACDVVIDFSQPGGLLEALKWCVKEKRPLVSGTTGLGKKHHQELLKAAKKIPVLYSANMSLGIAVMMAMLDSLKTIADWDFQIEEAHHHHKKDKPSGTALLLERKLEQVIGRPPPSTLSLRGGSLPGLHQVWAMGPDETLTIQHNAYHRKIFARGALVAARWLFDKKDPGLYDLTDLYRVI